VSFYDTSSISRPPHWRESLEFAARVLYLLILDPAGHTLTAL